MAWFQRQAISRVVSGVGCLAVGDLAMDRANLKGLVQSGACEAVVVSESILYRVQKNGFILNALPILKISIISGLMAQGWRNVM